MFFVKGQHHPKPVFNSGPKVGPALNKKTISMRFFILGFQCHMENNKAAPSAPLQKGRREAPPPCLPFGKDFLCFCIISGARSGSGNKLIHPLGGLIFKSVWGTFFPKQSLTVGVLTVLDLKGARWWAPGVVPGTLGAVAHCL